MYGYTVTFGSEAFSWILGTHSTDNSTLDQFPLKLLIFFIAKDIQSTQSHKIQVQVHTPTIFNCQTIQTLQYLKALLRFTTSPLLIDSYGSLNELTLVAYTDRTGAATTVKHPYNLKMQRLQVSVGNY